MKPALLSGALLLAAAGFAQAQSPEGSEAVVRAKMEADAAKCQATEFATRREAAQCVNQAVQRAMMAANYPYGDLLQLVAAYRIACAQKMDARGLSEAQCNDRLAQLRSRVTAEESRRDKAGGKTSAVKPSVRKQWATPSSLVAGLAVWGSGTGAKAAKPSDIVCLDRAQTITCY